MVQRKWNLPVADSRISEERDQQGLDIMAAVSMVKVPMAPPALGDLHPYSAEGAVGNEPEFISPSQTRQGTKLGGGQAPITVGQYTLPRLPVGVGSEGQPAGYYWAHTPFSISDYISVKLKKLKSLL